MLDKESLILAIETNCDETAAAVVADGNVIKSSVVASQTKLHERFGGIGAGGLARVEPADYRDAGSVLYDDCAARRRKRPV